MGQRGPAKKPTQLALLHGDKKSRINTDAPVAAEGVPTPPYELSPAAREVWDFTVEQLGAMKTLSPADRDILVAYCEAVVSHRTITAALRENPKPMVLNYKGDTLLRNPLITMQKDAATLVRILAREFGLTPSARSDISLGGSRQAPGNGGPERLLS